MVALLETRINGNKADMVIVKLGFENSFIVKTNGFAGGFWILWNDNLKVEVLKAHTQFVHLWIQKLGEQVTFLSSVIYASPRKNWRVHLWENLVRIDETVNEPWILSGDFNAILNSEKRTGGWNHAEQVATSSILSCLIMGFTI